MMLAKITKMLGSVFLRAWGRGKTSMLAVIVALTLFTAPTALAANGGNFILGVATNTATAITQLTANISNPALHLKNTSTGTNATALKLETATTKAPMTVNSGTKVANLNADKVDGKSAEQLTRVANMDTGATTPIPVDASVVTYGDKLSITAPASGFVRVNGNVTVENPTCTSLCKVEGEVRHNNTGLHSIPAQEDVTFNSLRNMSLDRVFPVSAGVNTFEIRLSRLNVNSNGVLNGYFGNLTAEYTPYGSTGTGTLSTTSAASAQEVPDK